MAGCNLTALARTKAAAHVELAEKREAAMSTNWRISSFNGALLAGYFIPNLTIGAYMLIVSPIHGLYERPNISVGLFISDHLQVAAITTVRLAWLLAF